MPNQFKGQVLDTPAGNKLAGVKVTITGNGISDNNSTITDTNGEWLITLKVDIDPKDVTITFSKPGLETTSVTNPQPTATLPGYIDPIKGGTLDLAGDYPSGKWKITSLSQEMQDIIDKEIADAYTFAKNNPGNFDLKIYSSESQVPNADNETGSNKNFSQPGSLAKARAENLKEYIDKKINELYAKETNPRFNKPTVSFGEIDRVGDVKWDGVNANDSKYTKDQYTRLKASFIVDYNKNCGPFIDTGLEANTGEVKLIKNPNESAIRFQTFEYPDRMGINENYQNFFSVSQVNIPIILLEFMVFVTSKNRYTKDGHPVDHNLTPKILSFSKLLDELTKILTISNVPVPRQWATKQFYDIIDKNNIPRNTAQSMALRLLDKYGSLGYEVRVGDTPPISIKDIPVGSEYTITTINGSPLLVSYYKYSICKIID